MTSRQIRIADRFLVPLTRPLCGHPLPQGARGGWCFRDDGGLDARTFLVGDGRRLYIALLITGWGFPMNRKLLGLAIVLVPAFAAPAFAHHSFSMFDADKTVTLSGTVKEFEWTN